MDCTYKTNKYNMPLLHITSHTSTEHTFTVAICFLRQETTADYLRAIMELRQMIPGLPAKCVITDAEAVLAAASKAYAPEWKHILCRWHLGQNILTEFKRQIISNREPFPLSRIGTHRRLLNANDLESEAAAAISSSLTVDRVAPPNYPTPSASQIATQLKRKAADDQLAAALRGQNLSRCARNAQSSPPRLPAIRYLLPR